MNGFWTLQVGLERLEYPYRRKERNGKIPHFIDIFRYSPLLPCPCFLAPSPLSICFQTPPFNNNILLFPHAQIPILVIILINPPNTAVLIHRNDHTHMALELLPARFHRHYTVRPDNVVGLATEPDLLEDGAC